MQDAVGQVQQVLVLGGNSEIGAAIVRALGVRAGGSVWRAARTAGAPWELPAGVIEQQVRWDAADPVAVEGLLAAIPVDLDVVVVAAGVLGDQDRAEDDVAHAADVLATNTTGAGAAVLAAAARLRRQGHGCLVVLSSVAGVRVRRANFVYGASKAGLDALACGVLEAARGSGTRVLVVRPGFVRTAMTAGLPPAPFATDAPAVGAAVAAAVRRGRSAVVYVPGVLRYVFTVLRALPAPLFRRLPG